MALHAMTFEYLKPTDEQIGTMADMRHRFAVLAQAVEAALPPGPDADHVLRLVRDAGMWANIAITRFHDGTPRP